MGSATRKGILTRSDLDQIGLRALEDFAIEQKAKSYSILTTSGTTGSGPLLIATRHNIDSASQYFSHLKRCVICTGSMSIRLMRALFLSLGERDTPARVLFLDHRSLGPTINDLLVQFAPDSIVGFPSFVIRTLELVSDVHVLERIRFIRLTGEPLSTAFERELRKKLPDATISVRYVATDAGGTISDAPCPYLGRNQYHPLPEVHIEIENPDETGVGEILISRNLSRNARLERYAIGDLGRMISVSCPCGRDRTFEVLGRAGYDYVKIAGAILRQEEFDRIAASLIDVLDDYRAEARTFFADGRLFGKIVIKAKVRRKGNHEDHMRIITEFQKKLFVTKEHTLDDLVKSGRFAPLEVELVDEFPQHGKMPGKLKRILD